MTSISAPSLNIKQPMFGTHSIGANLSLACWLSLHSGWAA